jgi:hypothetical protein
VKVPARQKQKGVWVALGSLLKPEEVPLGGQNLMLPLKKIRFQVEVLHCTFFLWEIEK